MHESSMIAMKKFIDGHLDKDKELSILDVGSLQYQEGEDTYKKLFDNPNWKYTGLDLTAGPNVDIVSNYPYSYPLCDCSFDVIISGQTLEHVGMPWKWIRELRRILKEDGLICLIAPGGGKRHCEKDYWRILQDGMESLLEYGGFEVLSAVRSKKGKWKDCVGIGKKKFQVS